MSQTINDSVGMWVIHNDEDGQTFFMLAYAGKDHIYFDIIPLLEEQETDEI